MAYSQEAEIFLADNGSQDDSVEYVHSNFPMVKTLCLDKNYGFTGGYNRALRQIDADFFILLNDDVEVTPDWISPLIEKMEEDKTIAVCQPKLLSYKDRNFFEYAGAAGGYLDYLGYPFCAGRIFQSIEQDKGQYNKEREIFWATGAAMFVRADVFRALNGLDEDFFAHMEEIDFCWRVKNAGYKVMYFPQSTVYHFGAATLQTNNPKKTFLNFRNNLLMLYKNLPEKEIRSVLFKRFVLDYFAAFVFLLQGHTGDFKAVVKARREFNKIKQGFYAKRQENIVSYPVRTLSKSIVIQSKLFRRNVFSEIENYLF